MQSETHELAAECDRLVAVADAMPAVAERRRAIAGAWYQKVIELAAQSSLETADGERELDRLTAKLRRAWMGTAHEYADATYRSPRAGDGKLLPSQAIIDYGYERSLESSPLDARLQAYRTAPSGWSARHLLFSSGMAALSGIAQFLTSRMPHGEPSALLGAVAYFETRELLSLGGFSTRITNSDADFHAALASGAPDVVFIEPIIYDPWLRPFDVRQAMHAAAQCPVPPIVVIDSTLVGPTLPMRQILAETPQLPLVIQANSGLKLDQAGLELANVGIVSIYAPAMHAESLDSVEERLQMLRRLNGTALTIDALALLDVPFFLDPLSLNEYTSALFGHNAALAKAVGAVATGGLFETVAHPSLDQRRLPWAQGPFVFFHLRDDSMARYAELEDVVIGAARKRGLVLDRGGSFGFRGHRCEAIELENEARNGVFKIALGARSGPSLHGIIALMAELAAFQSVADARAALT